LAVWIPFWDVRCEKCSDSLKIINGCEKDCNQERWRIREWTWTRCPLKIVTNQSVEYLNAYKLYKNGLLPMSGGWMSQAQSFIEAIGIIEMEIGKFPKPEQK
jgi:hypothetical protein